MSVTIETVVDVRLGRHSVAGYLPQLVTLALAGSGFGFGGAAFRAARARRNASGNLRHR
ncbi:hypothetical protein [Paractinoplanes durhamensis]|uniref:Uncharacterized protein n=1 Tax=Paractinoplanes durhamensis TaxID=113563 RepID=A0ABQ3Z052_9ACTN|nr:hypothetical protein [Actinoplanes durhamensis]GIE03160.1 hypothetical protein Adu01nite_45100 [Actinoplanes durhamensis]